MTSLLAVAVLALILAGHVVLSRVSSREWLPQLVAGLSILFSVFLLGGRPLGIVASVATISGVAPQVLLLVGERRAAVTGTAGVSRTRWALCCAANLCWVAYGVLLGDVVIIVNSSAIAALAVAIVVLAGERSVTARSALPEYAASA